MQPIRLKPFQFVFGFVSFEQLVQREFIERSKFFCHFMFISVLFVFGSFEQLVQKEFREGSKSFCHFMFIAQSMQRDVD